MHPRIVVTIVLGALVLAGAAVYVAGFRPAPRDEIVRRAVDACSTLPRREKQDCYQEVLLDRLERQGPREAMATLEAIAAADRGVETDGHVYAHAIGIEAYRLDPALERVFVECTEAFQSGCYHGVIQAHFVAAGQVDSADVATVCEPYKGPDRDRWLLFQCLHGLGHGLTMFYAHHLPTALDRCDDLTDPWDRESCYGGAFMENIMHATAPHHPASELAGEGHDAGGHGHGGHGSAPAEPFTALDPDDPLYPCSIMESRYLRACYMMQTSAMLAQNGWDLAAAAEACGDAPEHMRGICFQSLGRDISGRTLQDPERSFELCRHADSTYRAWCYIGVAKNFVDVTANTDNAARFCRLIPDRTDKAKCYEALGEQIAVLASAQAERARLCETVAEEGYLEACRWGARIR